MNSNFPNTVSIVLNILIFSNFFIQGDIYIRKYGLKWLFQGRLHGPFGQESDTILT